MNINHDNIPYYNSLEFRNRFFNNSLKVNQIFKHEFEHFLIAKFEDIREVMTYPTPHYRRPIIEVLFITQGSITRGCYFNKVTVAPHQLHVWSAKNVAMLDHFSEDIAGFYCHFDLEYLAQSHNAIDVVNGYHLIHTLMYSQALDLPKNSFVAIHRIFERLHEIFHQAYNPLLISTYLITLLVEIIQCIDQSATSPLLPGRALKIVNEFNHHLFKHIRTEQSLKFYANQLCITQGYLNKVLKQVTGKSASNCLYEALALEAKALLVHSQDSIGQIAFQLGFSDASHFARFFKKHLGVSPSYFRKKS
ncbi:hypothetical protein BKI52_20830 [marine bacterium AO1-C]|nr:hypothetical protein BKI52_20830 [marine bacterium AO1-C]